MRNRFFEHDQLHSWFDSNRRDFQWRRDRHPYSVWVSEIMLQQTRASVVIDYFNRWMKQFPDIGILASASKEEVLKAWEGLGYYSRARNLHEGARQVLQEFGGKLPQKREELEKIKGLGPYTVGAIMAFGFGKPTAAVDGNVFRVLARYFSILDDLSSSKTQKQIRKKADQILERGSAKTSEAMIELGAMVCIPKNPNCKACPLQTSCLGYAEGIQESLPYKSKKIEYIKLHRAVAVIEADQHLLVQKKNTKLMQDLYEFPYSDFQKEFLDEEINQRTWEKLGLKLEKKRDLSRLQQSFTKYRVDLYPFLFTSSSMGFVEKYDWVSLDKIEKLTFSSGHRKILKEYIS